MRLAKVQASLRRIATLVRREVQTTLRDRFTLFILVTVPLASMLAFGFIVSTEVHGIRLGVVDAAQSALSRRIVAELEANDAFASVPMSSRREVEAALVAGKIGAAILIPPDFEEARRRAASTRGEGATIQLFYDGAEPVLAGNAQASMRGILRAALAAEGGGPVQVASRGVAVTARPVFNATLDGRPYMVAGTFGFVLTFLTTLITAVSIVNERLSGTFEQLQLTPATSLEILLGKLLPLGAVFSFDLILLMLAAGFLLGTWPEGSALLFWVVATLYVGTSLALGLIFSATSATAAEAVQKTVLASIPLIQLSGFVYPVRNMPQPVRTLAQLIPATHFLEVSRAIYLRGEGIVELWPELAVLTAMGLTLVGLALVTLESRS